MTMWRPILILPLLTVTAMAQSQQDVRTDKGYWACVSIMRSCNSMTPQVRQSCPTTGVPAACRGLVQQWNAAHPDPGDGPRLTAAATAACDAQSIDNATGDSAASAQDGAGCVW